MFDVLLVEVVSSDTFDRVDSMWHTIVVNVEDLVLVDSCDCEIICLLVEGDGLDVIAEVEMGGFEGGEALLSGNLLILRCIIFAVDYILKWVVYEMVFALQKDILVIEWVDGFAFVSVGEGVEFWLLLS